MLRLIEHGDVTRALMPADPVAALRQISHDPTLRTTVELTDGRRMTGLDILWAYYEMVDDHLSRHYGHDLDEETQEIMTRWDHLMVMLGDDVLSAAHSVDWVAKLALFERVRGLEVPVAANTFASRARAAAPNGTFVALPNVSNTWRRGTP